MASQYKNHAAVWTTSIEQIQYQKGRHFLAILTQNWHWFTCTRCSSICDPEAPNVQIQIGCHVKYVESLSQLFECCFLPFRLRALNWEQLLWFGVKSKMVNSNVPHLRSLVSGSCIEIIIQVKILILSSVRSNKHMMALLSALCQRSDYKLVHLSSRRYNGEIVQLQSTLNDDYNISQKKSNTYHISEPIFERFFPNLVLVRSLRSSFIDSFSSAKKRCNNSQGFGAFFSQSCDRNRFLFPFISDFLSLFFSFLIL